MGWWGTLTYVDIGEVGTITHLTIASSVINADDNVNNTSQVYNKLFEAESASTTHGSQQFSVGICIIVQASSWIILRYNYIFRCFDSLFLFGSSPAEIVLPTNHVARLFLHT